MAAGVVTTTRVTDATPAATYAHVAEARNRNRYRGGAGAGRRGLTLTGGGVIRTSCGSAEGGMRTDGRDLLAEMRAKGLPRAVQDRRSRNALDDRAAQPVIGLFARPT